jgi:hypothetical protein
MDEDFDVCCCVGCVIALRYRSEIPDPIELLTIPGKVALSVHAAAFPRAVMMDYSLMISFSNYKRLPQSMLRRSLQLTRVKSPILHNDPLL